MRVQIAARHCDLPDPVRARTEVQIQKLTKYDPRVSSAEVVFEVEKHLKKVEGILSVDRDEPVVAHGEGDEFREAVDQMVDRLARMLRRRRSQRTDHQATRLTGAERAAAD
ncbi:MAG TPA: ribosome-associated translation inhibitor RaiA [Longimicrobiales bacterium]|nr:ribosome-associated translation inhibitor RaiA [Longimicrobiales bacterium]